MNAAFTARARAAMAQSRGIYASADLLQGGVVVVPNIALDEDASPSVQVDGTAAVRRTFSATLADPLAYGPLTSTSRLSPFLSEIVVYSGITYADGTYDRWPVFTGAIEDPRVSDTDDDVMTTITASDRAQNISERRLSSAYVVASGTSVTTAIQGLINSVRPGIVFSTSTPVSNPTLPAVVIAELEDPWQHAMDMAASYGMEVFFNAAGVCVVRPIPDPSIQLAAWTFAEGATSTLKTIETTLSAKDSYSHAIVVGQSLNGAAPVRSDQYDNDPSSPTYHAGPFGDRPVKLQSDMISTQPQADAAALALLSRKKGATENVGFTSVPITALDEYDVVALNRARVGINDFYALEKFSIPLTAGGEMAATCRSRQA